jgi:hypothetical protein
VSPFAIDERASAEDDHDQENAGPKSHALLYPIRYAVRGPSQPATACSPERLFGFCDLLVRGKRSAAPAELNSRKAALDDPQGRPAVCSWWYRPTELQYCNSGSELS